MYQYVQYTIIKQWDTTIMTVVPTWRKRDIAFSGEYTNILLEMLVQYIVGIYFYRHLVGVRGLNIGRI